MISMANDTNFSMRVDSTLKAQTEDVLNELGLSISGAVAMFFKQIVREQAVPLNHSLHPRNGDVYSELVETQVERINGCQGRNSRDVLADMQRIAGEAEAVG